MATNSGHSCHVCGRTCYKTHSSRNVMGRPAHSCGTCGTLHKIAVATDPAATGAEPKQPNTEG